MKYLFLLLGGMYLSSCYKTETVPPNQLPRQPANEQLYIQINTTGSKTSQHQCDCNSLDLTVDSIQTGYDPILDNMDANGLTGIYNDTATISLSKSFWCGYNPDCRIKLDLYANAVINLIQRAIKLAGSEINHMYLTLYFYPHDTFKDVEKIEYEVYF